MLNMRKYLFTICCCFLLMLLPVMTVRAEDENSQIPSPIKISEFTINGESFGIGDTMQYSFDMQDVGIDEYLESWTGGFVPYEYGEPPYYYGANTVYVYWVSTGKQYIVQAFNWSDEDIEKKALHIEGSIAVKKGMQPGNWSIAAIYIEYGNEEVLVMDKTEVYANDVDEYEYTPWTDFGAKDFIVIGTKADNKAPKIQLKSLNLSKKYIKNKKTSKFSVKVKDSSEIETVVAVWDVYSKYNKSKTGDYFDYYSMKYNKKKKRYECNVTLNARHDRKAQLVGIEVRDIYGNSEIYYSYYAHKGHDEDSEYFYVGKSINKKYYNAYKKMSVQIKK